MLGLEQRNCKLSSGPLTRTFSKIAISHDGIQVEQQDYHLWLLTCCMAGCVKQAGHLHCHCSTDNNPEELCKIAATLKPSDPAIQLKKQGKFYSSLVKSIADNCWTAWRLCGWSCCRLQILGLHSGTCSWISTRTPPTLPRHTIINLANFCLSFKLEGGKWSI